MGAIRVTNAFKLKASQSVSAKKNLKVLALSTLSVTLDYKIYFQYSLSTI